MVIANDSKEGKINNGIQLEIARQIFRRWCDKKPSFIWQKRNNKTMLAFFFKYDKA